MHRVTKSHHPPQKERKWKFEMGMVNKEQHDTNEVMNAEEKEKIGLKNVTCAPNMMSTSRLQFGCVCVCVVSFLFSLIGMKINDLTKQFFLPPFRANDV